MARSRKRCKCGELATRRVIDRAWVTHERQCFVTSAGRKIDSRYSRVVCPKCGVSWRTKARYAAALPPFQGILDFGEGES